MSKKSPLLLAGLLSLSLLACGNHQAPVAEAAAAPAASEAAPAAAPTPTGITGLQAREAFEAAAAREVAASFVAADNRNQFAELEDQRQYRRVDTDGDGIDDAVVGVLWLQQVDANHGEQKVLAWRANGDSLVELDTSAVEGGRIKTFSVRGNQLDVVYLTAGPDDAACCPSVEQTQGYVLGQSRVEPRN